MDEGNGVHKNKTSCAFPLPDNFNLFLPVLWKTELHSAFLHTLFSLFLVHPVSRWTPLNLMPISSIDTVSELYCLPFLAKTLLPGCLSSYQTTFFSFSALSRGLDYQMCALIFTHLAVFMAV